MFDWRVFCVFFFNTCSYYLDPEKILVPDWLRMERIELLVGGFEHVLFFHSVGNFIIPTDELIFFRGVGQPPTRIGLSFWGILDSIRAHPNLQKPSW